MTLPDAQPSACRVFFGDAPMGISRLRASGFSGSEVLLVEVSAGDDDRCDRWVVKSFGRGHSPGHAAWTHALMGHLRDRGIETVPEVRRVPVGTRRRGLQAIAPSLVEDGEGLLWEAVRFMPGRPADPPDGTVRAAAMRALAEIHLAAATLPGSEPRRCGSRGLAERIERARKLVEIPWRSRWRRETADAVAASHGVRVGAALARALEAFAWNGEAAVGEIARHDPGECTCQAVLRDVWSDHVLFDAGRVSGIIDFHAAGIDTTATDLARLVGSWLVSAAGSSETTVSPASGARSVWEECFTAYETIRPLGPGERTLAIFLHHAGVIVAIDNWFRWLVEERRTFPDASAVASRLEGLVAAVPQSLESLARAG